MLLIYQYINTLLYQNIEILMHQTWLVRRNLIQKATCVADVWEVVMTIDTNITKIKEEVGREERATQGLEQTMLLPNIKGKGGGTRMETLTMLRTIHQ